MAIDPTYLPQLLFEIFITIIFGCIILDIFLRSRVKKTEIAKKLTIFMGLYFITIFLTTFYQFNLEVMSSALIPDNYMPLFGQLDKTFTYAANYAYYLFYIEIFRKYGSQQRKNKYLKISAIILIIFTLMIALFGEKNYNLLYTLNALFLLVHSIFIFIPSLKKSSRLYRGLDKEIEGKSAVFSIVLMSFFFILVWIFNILDVMWDIITNILYGPFWLLIWIFILFAVISGYLGFVNPPWFKKLTNKKTNEKNE